MYYSVNLSVSYFIISNIHPAFTKIYEDPEWNVPESRRPSKKHIQNVFAAARTRDRLAKSSFEGLAILAYENPERIYGYVFVVLM